MIFEQGTVTVLWICETTITSFEQPFLFFSYVLQLILFGILFYFSAKEENMKHHPEIFFFHTVMEFVDRSDRDIDIKRGSNIHLNYVIVVKSCRVIADFPAGWLKCYSEWKIITLIW